MKFKCFVGNLLPGLAQADSITKGVKLPLIKNVLFEADSKVLKMTATDLETWMVRSYKHDGESCCCEKMGRLLVDCKQLYKIVKLLPKEELITIEHNQLKKVDVRCGRLKYTFDDWQKVDEYPTVAKDQEPEIVPINSKDFLEALKHIIHIPQKVVENGRSWSSGVLFDVDKFVVTDGHRLAINSFPIKVATVSSSVPRKACIEAMALAKEVDISIGVSEQYFCVQSRSGNIKLKSRLFDTAFPGWEAISTEHENNFTLDKNDLLNSIKRCIALSNKLVTTVTFDIGKESFISINNPDVGTVREEIDIECDGKHKIGLNVEYVLCALNAIPKTEKKIGFSFGDGSATIRSKNNIELIMEARI